MRTLTTADAPSLDALLAILLAGAEDIDTAELPTYGGTEPRDTSLVYSWDESRLLTHGVRGAGWQIVARA